MTGGYLGEVSPRQREKLERMIAKSQHLLGLVREYLDLARIESGSLEANVRSIGDYVAEVVKPAVDIVASSAEEKDMTIEQHLPDEAVALECDPDLVRIVLVNLLSNAVKYGNDGGVVRVTVAATAGDVQTAVWNEGPGFPASQQGRLFRRFSRLQTPELLQRTGTGVGLYTSWRIIQLHGGRIRADSEVGRWAEFSFSIPRTPQQAGA
jgi:signal transduction histidine kinase